MYLRKQDNKSQISKKMESPAKKTKTIEEEFNERLSLKAPVTKLDVWVKSGKWQLMLKAYNEAFPLDPPLKTKRYGEYKVADDTPEDDETYDVASLVKSGHFFLYTQLFDLESRVDDPKYIERYPADFAKTLRLPEDVKQFVLYKMKEDFEDDMYILCGRFNGTSNAFALAYRDGKLVRITGPKAEQGSLFEPTWIPSDLPVVHDPEAKDMYRKHCYCGCMKLQQGETYTVDELERRFFIVMFARFCSRGWDNHPLLRSIIA